MDAAIAAIVGAVIGSISSIGAIYIQQKAAHKRDITKMATDLAVAEFGWVTGLAKHSRSTVLVPPLSTYLVYHAEILKAIDEEEMTPERMAKIKKSNDILLKSLEVGDPV
jgi:cytoskeletal protein CcmA (bactofilin family)